jgi:hypothetical protein
VNKKRKVKGVKAVAPVKKGHRVNSFNVLQRELAGYFRENNIDWRKETGKSSFAAVAGAVYKNIPEEGRSARGINAAIDAYYVDTFGSDRAKDLSRIKALYGGASWWLFDVTINGVMDSVYFKNQDVVEFDGEGVVPDGTFTQGARDDMREIYSRMKSLLLEIPRDGNDNYPKIALDYAETDKRSDDKKLVLVYKLAIKESVLSDILGIEPKPVVTVPEAQPAGLSEKEQHKIRMAELNAKAKIEAIELKKLDKKLTADIKKTALKSKQKIAVERIKSKERTEKIRISESVKSIDKLFRDGKITFKQYSSMILKLKK